MKVEFLFVGKLTTKYLKEGIEIYHKRINHYLPASITEVPSAVTSGKKEYGLKKESEAIMKKIAPNDFVVLLDERGKEHNSVQLSMLMNKSMVNGISKLVFIVGGPYGSSETISTRANLILSFSKFTLTHEMIRLFLLEQVYRAMSILNNEPYHHV